MLYLQLVLLEQEDGFKSEPAERGDPQDQVWEGPKHEASVVYPLWSQECPAARTAMSDSTAYQRTALEPLCPEFLLGFLYIRTID